MIMQGPGNCGRGDVEFFGYFLNSWRIEHRLALKGGIDITSYNPERI
jgi:hypothetical protein